MEAWLIAEALDRLTPSHRQVLIECFYRGRSVADAAARLGVPPGHDQVPYALRAARAAACADRDGGDAVTCPQLVDSGVYVLGALAPGAALAFERHMATCAECQAEVNDLAVLPACSVGWTKPTVVAQAAEAAGDADVLPGVLAKVRRQRRGTPGGRVRRGAFAVACLALVAGLAMPQPVGTTARHTIARPERGRRPHADACGRSQRRSVPLRSADAGRRRHRDRAEVPVSVERRHHVPGSSKFRSVRVSRATVAAPQQVGTWSASPATAVTVPAMTGWPIVHTSPRIELRNDGRHAAARLRRDLTPARAPDAVTTLTAPVAAGGARPR